MTYTISVKERCGSNVIPLTRGKVAIDVACKSAWLFSQQATLCDVVVTCGKKHVATYRDGNITHYNGKEQKP